MPSPEATIDLTRAAMIQPTGPRVGGTSPWGYIDAVDRRGPLTFANTPSHGGWYVPAKYLHRIPEAHQRWAASWSGSPSWYEEDCCAAAVVLAFPELFQPDEIALAEDYLTRWLPQEVTP